MVCYPEHQSCVYACIDLFLDTFVVEQKFYIQKIKKYTNRHQLRHILIFRLNSSAFAPNGSQFFVNYNLNIVYI